MTIPKECKRLAEVDFPIAEVSAHAAREKSIRHGHPSTLHLWWARRPLASSRAVLLAPLLPDPCDELCPADFKDAARKVLPELVGQIGGDDLALRRALLKFIGDFANWDMASNTRYLDASRALVRAAHPEETPLVVDPFAGGGSIPLEALRLGCDAFASDLNPVACLILKVMLEDIPRHGPELADELRRVGAEIKAAAEKELSEFYPADPDGARPIAYLWARTVKCDNCGAEIPLVRSFWLSKSDHKHAMRFNVNRPPDQVPSVEFEIFGPKKEDEVPVGTIRQAKATCLCCGTVLLPKRLRAQLSEQRGGANVIFDIDGKRIGGARLLAIVIVKSNGQRIYRLPNERDYHGIYLSQQATKKVVKEIPAEPLPSPRQQGVELNTAYYNFIPAKLYGLENWGDLFTARQQLGLITLTSKLRALPAQSSNEKIVKTLCTLAVGRTADQMSSFVRWLPTIEAVASTFGRQALPMVWDFVEIVPTGKVGANYKSAIEWIAKVVETQGPAITGHAQCEQADAKNSTLPDESCGVWFTDPPYYDAVPYADLSDFFFVWLKRALPGNPILRDPFNPDNPLTPKHREIIDTYHLLRGVPKDRARGLGFEVKDREFFENSMTDAFAEGHRVLREDGIGCVVFAHKTTEGWEALLSGIKRAGLVITSSWPITTERGVRMRAMESAALAGSVHLVCRPRPDDAQIGDWSDVLRELPKRVADWIERLQSEGVRGADLVFACIGPALEIYSRYSKVVDAEDREIPLGGNPEATEPYQRGYLAYVWEVVGRAALEQVLGTAEARARNGAAGALEEDARLTALFLWTLQSTNANEPKGNEPVGQEEDEDQEDEEEGASKKKAKGFSLVFDVARRFAQPLGIHLPDWEGRIIETDKGIVRLLSVSERAKQLFGEEGADAVATQIEERPERAAQMQFAFMTEEMSAAPKIRGRGGRSRSAANVPDEALGTRREATTLDRVHAAMVLQKSGRTNALRALLQAEQDRGPDFLRLANSLSALYPRDSEEKRLLDAMLLAMQR